MQKYKTKNKNKGFSLIETIIYVAMFAVFVGSLMTFSNMLTNTRINNQISQEVNNQGNFAVRIITQSIRNATAINTPSSGATGSTLSLATIDVNKDPTIFSIVDGVLYITESSLSPVALTNDKVIISDLVFSNLSKTSTSGSMQVRFKVSSNISNSNNYVKVVDFYGSGTIKN